MRHDEREGDRERTAALGREAGSSMCVCVCVYVCVFVWMCVWSCFDEDVIRAVICQSVTGEAVCCFFGGRFEARTHDQAPCVRVNVNTER